MDFLYFVLDAPLMSFGDTSVDQYGPSGTIPTRSMVTGIVANALGWDHGDWNRLQTLQDSLRVGARADLPGMPLRDYQTVDLGQDFMLSERAWTTRGQVDKRGGGSAKGTHIRYRDYIADAAYLVAMTLSGPDASVTLETIRSALKTPVRPLFIGRKPCLPTVPFHAKFASAADFFDLFSRIPRYRRPALSELLSEERPACRLSAWWPFGFGPVPNNSVLRQVASLKDWKNHVHVGAERIIEAPVACPCWEEDHDT